MILINLKFYAHTIDTIIVGHCTALTYFPSAVDNTQILPCMCA